MASLKINKLICLIIRASTSSVTRLKHSTAKELATVPMGKHWSTVKARNKVIRMKTEEKQDADDNLMEDIAEETPKFEEIYEEESMNLERRHAAMKFNITRRKYFREPPEPCLLTWAAREQLRYLHHTDPKQWTVEELAKSFPISEDGVKKLLRSKFTLKTEEEIARWDERIAQRWKGKKMGGGPIKVKLPEKGKNGNSLINVEDTSTTPKKRYFSSILDKYAPKTKNAEPKQILAVKNEVRDEHMEINGLENTRRNKFARQLTADQFLQQNKIPTKNELPVSTRAHATNSSLNNADQPEQINNLKRADADDTENDFDTETFRGRNKYVDQTKIDLKLGTRYDKREKEAYLYDDQLGYQRPLGITDDIPEKITVNPNDAKDGLIRVGDKFYNEKGEFLYRVPGMTN